MSEDKGASVTVLGMGPMGQAPAADALGGRTVVNLTADTPERARKAAAWAAEHGIDYLDGAIMTPTTTIGGPSAVVIYSGPEAVYQAHRATLAGLGGTGSHPGDEANISSAEAGMAHIQDAALARGIDASLITAARGMARRAIEAGHGGDGFSRLIEVMRQPTPVR